MKSRLIPVILISIFTSCGTQDVCDDDNQSFFVARFRTTVTGDINDTIVAGISIYGIREGRTDSLLYDSTEVGRMELPLDPSSDQSKFVLTIAEERDTLLLMHTSEAYLISYNCGFAARFTLQDFTAVGGIIADMELISASIDGENEINEEHLWIYF